MGALLYDPPRRPDLERGLEAALDHLDGHGLCCCWVTDRAHQETV